MPISLDEVSYTFEVPSLEKVPKSKRDELLDEIGEYLLDSVLDYVGEAKSPVAGGRYKSTLSEAYADSQKMGDTTANLDLTGGMLNSLQIITDPSSGTVTIGIFDTDETPKAYNHQVGDTIPQRQFLPNEGENFKAEILRGVGRILSEYIEDED